MKYKIVSENNEFLVINKPAGLLVHGASHIKESSLVDDLRKKYPSIKKIGDDPHRPGIMHRLDKLVSGLMVIAKRQDSFDNLKDQFKNRTIKKYYTALVFGKIEKDEDEINFPIKRSVKGHKMAALPFIKNGEKNPDGKRAITEFSIIKKFINYTLVKVRIKTGRTHQVRVHLAAYGHPIIGDYLYFTKKSKAKNEKLNLNRIFLVADELEFTDLSGNKQNFKINLPSEIINFIKELK